MEWGSSRLERSLRASLKPDFRVQMCGGHVVWWSGLRQRDAYTYMCGCLASSLDAQGPYVCYQRYAARLQRRADTCITHNMHQTDLHLLGTAPPMPPPPLLQSLPEPPLIPGCGRMAYVAGWEGLHAPLEQYGNVQPRQRGQRKSARASKHQQNTAKQYACMRAIHT